VEFFCYHRDRPGSTPLRHEMVEQHWSYMDRFEETMTVRGPTFAADGSLTGSVHVLGLPDAAAARAFAFEEPCYQAGAYRDVLVRRWHDSLGPTMWEHAASGHDSERYLVIGFTREPAADATSPALRDEMIACGLLLSDDGAQVVGAAVLLEAAGSEAARGVLDADRFVGVEVHRWRPGGRPS
jgi:uncharacterized protein